MYHAHVLTDFKYSFVLVSTVGIQLLGEVLHVLIATLKGSLAHQLRPGSILRQ